MTPPTPTGTLSLDDPRFHTDPAGLYEEARRRHGPVAPVLLPAGIPAWLVIGYRELHQVTGDADLFPRDSALWNQWHRVPADWPLLDVVGHRVRTSVREATGTAHRHRIGLIGAALDAVDPLELRRSAETLADRLIDTFCVRGRADLVADYAMELPALVTARLLGLDDAEGPPLARALHDVAAGGARAAAGRRYLGTCLGSLLDRRRARPGADVASRLLAAAGGVPEADLAEDLVLLTLAGHQPTADWIGSTLLRILTDDRFTASPLGGRNSVTQAMNEVLWEESPTQVLAGRWAARDTRLADRDLRAGDLLLLGLQGANNDPAIREGRAVADGASGGNGAHFAFGHGARRCPFPAQEIAETVTRTGVEILLDRLPDVEPATPPGGPARRATPWLRGPAALPARFTAVPVRGTGLVVP